MVSYFSRILRFRSSSICRKASRLGPRPPICRGSMRTARASSSSLSSRISPYISRCSKAPETMSGGGWVGLGKFLGSNFWYVWITPPRCGFSLFTPPIVSRRVLCEHQFSPDFNEHHAWPDSLVTKRSRKQRRRKWTRMHANEKRPYSPFRQRASRVLKSFVFPSTRVHFRPPLFADPEWSQGGRGSTQIRDHQRQSAASLRPSS